MGAGIITADIFMRYVKKAERFSVLGHRNISVKRAFIKGVLAEFGKRWKPLSFDLPYAEASKVDCELSGAGEPPDSPSALLSSGAVTVRVTPPETYTRPHSGQTLV